MGEIFLVNINCTKVLGGNDLSHYTMFIDSSKMSIVYELVEWIRWMFSLETCFFITHNSSVIHELEDIQLLSRLQNFELEPCGRTNCVHKKLYRTLLKNLNLFVSWNGLEVHKYFLHKLNRMGEKLTLESNKASPRIQTSSPNKHTEFAFEKGSHHFLDFKEKKIDNTKNINLESNDFHSCENSLAETRKDIAPFMRKTTLMSSVDPKWRVNNDSMAETNYFSDQKINGNLSNSEDNFSCLNETSNAGGENSIAESTKTTKGSINNVSPKKNKLVCAQDSKKNCGKPNSKKHVKPFSLGEILSSMREEFEKQKTEAKMKKCSPSSSAAASKEADFDEKEENTMENSFEPELIKTSGGRKRQRSRRRRKVKKENIQEFITQFLDKSTADYSLDMPPSTSGLKPNHIRFDSDEEDNLMETDYAEDNLKIGNQTRYDSISKELKKSNEFLENKPEESVPMVTDNEEAISGLTNTKNKVSVSDQFVEEEKLIDLDTQSCDNTKQLHTASGNFQMENLNPDLNLLLSLKEKFKNGVVIERFY